MRHVKYINYFFLAGRFIRFNICLQEEINIYYILHTTSALEFISLFGFYNSIFKVLQKEK